MPTDLSRRSAHQNMNTKTEVQPLISDPERELIAFFVNAAQSIGLPKSYGEIYGLFFASAYPLALDEVIHKLQISKGSASQGIRFLKSINALNSTYQPGDRRDHYTAETSLRRIADGFIKERMIPQLKDGTERLKQIKLDGSNSHLQERISSIQNWSKKAEMLFPIVSKFLGAADKTGTLSDLKPRI